MLARGSRLPSGKGFRTIVLLFRLIPAGIMFVEFLCPFHLGAQQLLVPDAEQHYQRALKLVQGADNVGAEAEFRKAWTLDPTEPKYVQGLVGEYIDSHQFAEALAVLRDYVQRCGPTAVGWTLQGEVLYQQKLYVPAYESLRNALRLSNENYRAHQLIGQILAINGRQVPGLDELNIAARQNPNDAQIWYYCGRLSYETGDYIAARDDFLACLKIRPDFSGARENLGLAYEAVHMPDKATTQYLEAIDLEKSGRTRRSEAPYVCLGLLRATQGSLGEAVDLLNEGLARNPNSAWANFELGRLLFKMGQDEAALSHLKRAAAIDENFSRPHFLLGKLYQKRHDMGASRVEFETFRKLNENPENRRPRMSPPEP